MGGLTPMTFPIEYNQCATHPARKHAQSRISEPNENISAYQKSKKQSVTSWESNSDITTVYTIQKKHNDKTKEKTLTHQNNIIPTFPADGKHRSN
jgi:hypothetical protein